MRSLEKMAIVLMLSLACAQAKDKDETPPPEPAMHFESAAALEKWVSKTWGGARKTELTYKDRKIVVYFRARTSGIRTSEPSVYAERNGSWMRVLTTVTCRCELEASLDGDALVLWRTEQTGDKKQRVEYLRYDLRNLDLIWAH